MLRVLAAIDGSLHADHAVDYAIRLAANGTQIEVVLLNVQPEILAWQTHGLAQETMLARREQEGQRAAQVAGKRLKAAGVRFELRIESGEAAETIARVALEHRSDMIVLGTRGMGAIANLVIGSVAYKVVHLANVPVTLVK
jgi:nucleotide-binding universal stress UspA family protein